MTAVKPKDDSKNLEAMTEPKVKVMHQAASWAPNGRCCNKRPEESLGRRRLLWTAGSRPTACPGR